MSGIWRHRDLFGELPATQPTLGEGDTPRIDLPELAKAWGLDSLQLKREDLNPNGSHKDRGLLFQVAWHRGSAPRTHVISSSGNAASSGSAACGVTGDRLVAFVSAETPASKLGRIAARGGVVVKASKPINFARYAARVFGLTNLRGTADPVASVGYRSLAGELTDADHVLTFSSSGISVRGIADGLDRAGSPAGLWSIQSGRCIALARALDPDAVEDPESPAGRLGARNPPGAPELASRLVARGGGALALDSAAVARGAALLADVGVHTSAEGAAVLAGIEDLARDRRIGGRVVGILTGAAHDDPPADVDVHLTSYLEVRAFFTDVLGLEPP